MKNRRLWTGAALLALLGTYVGGGQLGSAQAKPLRASGLDYRNPALRSNHRAEFEYLKRREGHQLATAPGQVNPYITAVNEQQALAAGSVAGGSWASMGPNPITFPGQTPTYTDTGRVLALAYDAPLGKLFLGSADGGVWKSTPGGAWTPVGDSLASMAVGAITIDSHDSTGNTIFAGTGEQAHPGDGFGGVGIYKSTNGGASWALEGASVFAQQSISTIVVDPTNDNYVYAGVVNYNGTGNFGVAVSTNAGVTWTEPSGIATLAGQNVTDLAVDNAGNLYAAVAGVGIYYSSESSHGSTWTSASSGLPNTNTNIFKLGLAPTTAGLARGSQVLYTAISVAETGALDGVYKSSNGGSSWTRVFDGSSSIISGFDQGWYDIYVSISPSDANTVYVGLTDIIKTSNGGSTWTNITNVYGGTPANIHPDQHAAADVSGTWYFGNDGGVYSTPDGGANFAEDNTNLALSQFYSGTVGSAAHPNYLLGGLQDNGTVDDHNPSSGSGWVQEYGGDGFYVALNPTDNTNAYGEYVNGRMYRTTDAWASSASIYDPIWLYDSAEFSAPFVMDPNTPTTLFAGRAHLWKLTNAETAGANPTWTDLGGPNSNDITAIAVSKSAPNTLYSGDDWYNVSGTGHNDSRGHLWQSIDGGSTWTDDGGSTTTGCTASNSSPENCPNLGSNVTSIAVDPGHSQIVYVTVNGFNGSQANHVFKSTNGGSTWSDISTALPDEPFQSVAIDPSTPTTIFAGSDTGVYISFDSGTTWSVLGTSLPNVAAFDLVPNAAGTELTAFTHGRGAWQIAVPVRVTVAINASSNLIEIPLPNTGVTSASQLVSSLDASGQLGSGAVALVATYSGGQYNVYTPGYSADMPLSDAQGLYVRTVRSGTWTVTGTAPTSGTSVALHPGWNLAAAPYPTSGLLSTAIASQASGCNPQTIARYNGGSSFSTWTSAAPNSFTVPSTAAFWIQCTASYTWTPS